MDASLTEETRKLTHSWMRHEQAWLQDYLVGSVEDPRLNIQSILTRHFLIEEVLGNRFAPLMEAELRFGVCLTWLVKQIDSGGGPEDFAAILHALRLGADNAEGIPVPPYLLQTFNILPLELGKSAIPDYLTPTLAWLSDTERTGLREAPAISLFMRLWNEALNDEPSSKTSVIEPACGSANDFRSIAASGLSRRLNYDGFDLCRKNIENARLLFPRVRFDVANAFEIPADDQAYDLAFAHDLFEHLSPDGIQIALREICRVTRRAMSLAFFSMHEEAESIIRPVEDYHWNTLSVAEIAGTLKVHGFEAQVISVHAFLREAFQCEDTHNRKAYTLRCYRTQGKPNLAD